MAIRANNKGRLRRFVEKWSRFNERITGVPFFNFGHRPRGKELAWVSIKEDLLFMLCEFTWILAFTIYVALFYVAMILADKILGTNFSGTRLEPPSFFDVLGGVALVLFGAFQSLLLAKTTVLSIWRNSSIMRGN